MASGVSGAGGERSERGLVPGAAQLALFILAIARSGRVRTEVALGELAISCGCGLTRKGQRTPLQQYRRGGERDSRNTPYTPPVAVLCCAPATARTRATNLHSCSATGRLAALH